MALTYIYKKYKDVYTVENTAITPIHYTIHTIECDSTKLIKTCDILPGQTATLPITAFDAHYLVTLMDLDTDESEELDILQYNNSLLYFIDGTEENICGCRDCKHCDGCNECEGLLNTLSVGLAFLHVNNPKYTLYLDTFSSELKCNYTQEVLCNILNNTFKGKKDIRNLALLNIATLYITFYLLDLAQATDVEEADYIKKKYKSSKILKCIRKLGIDVDNFNEELFDDMQVYYWQLEDILNDISTELPLITDLYLASKEVDTLENFEEGRIVSYAGIARIAFAIRPTDVANFTISDSLGNDITDEFDNDYNSLTHTVLFVSKVPYSVSNIFFKFKKLTYTP